MKKFSSNNNSCKRNLKFGLIKQTSHNQIKIINDIEKKSLLIDEMQAIKLLKDETINEINQQIEENNYTVEEARSINLRFNT